MTEQGFQKRSVTLSDELIDQISAAGHEHGREFSAQARHLLKIGLDHEKPPKNPRNRAFQMVRCKVCGRVVRGRPMQDGTHWRPHFHKSPESPFGCDGAYSAGVIVSPDSPS